MWISAKHEYLNFVEAYPRNIPAKFAVVKRKF
jgi:hypothetical protein